MNEFFSLVNRHKETLDLIRMILNEENAKLEETVFNNLKIFVEKVSKIIKH
jgi:hypothetical protein